MMKNKFIKLFKKINVLLILVVYLVGNIQPVFAVTSKAYSSKIINGSPIITGNWETESGEMSTEEAIALTIYMSNYTIPMYDNFESAFTTGTDFGSKGQGLKYITFNDSDVIRKSMQEIYDKVISIQTAPENTLNLMKRKKGEEADSGDIAKLKDIGDMGEYVFYVDVGGSPRTVLDFTNEADYDKTMFACGFLKSAGDDAIKKEVNKNLDNMWDSQLGFDQCGNIVVLGDDDKPNLIVMPACLNPRLFNNHNTINFINDYMLTRITTSDVDGAFNFDIGKINIRDVNEDSEKQTKWIDGTKFGIVLNHNVKGVLFGEGKIGSILDKADESWKEQKGATVINEIFEYTGESLGYLINDKVSPTQKNWNMRQPIVDAMRDAGVRIGDSYPMAKRIYANYLMIAFKNEGKEGWDTSFFKDTAEAIKNAVGIQKLTQEEKVEAITDIFYSYITDDKSMVKKITSLGGELRVNWYEEAVNYNAERLNGGTQIFSVDRMGKNPVTGWLIKFLVNNLSWVILFVMGITIFIGLISQSGGFVNYIFKGLTISVLIILMPILFNRILKSYENVMNSLFQRDANYYAINESIKWENLMGNHANITDEDTKAYIQMYNNLMYDTNSYIKYDQDKSPVVINNATEEMMNIIQSTVTGQMFLGSLLRQYQSSSNLRDRTSGLIIDMYKKWFNVVALWDDTVAENEVGLVQSSLIISNSAFANISREKVSGSGLKSKFLSDSERKMNWADYQSVRGDEEYKSYTNRELGTDLNKDTTYNTVVKAVDDNGNEKQSYETLYYGLPIPPTDIHKSFYLLDGLNLNNANKFQNDLGGTVSNNEESAIKNIYNKLILDNGNASILKLYNETDGGRKINRNYGYMYLTENVAPYFYAVYYDLFGDKKTQDIAHMLMGGLVTEENGGKITAYKDSNGILLRDSVLVYHNKIRDFADLEELFTNVIPYCWRVMTISDKAFDNEKITEDEYPMYQGNPKRWLFDCNWIPKVINTLGKSYGQIKIYSEIQGEPTNKGENLIQEFYKNLYPQIEQLVNYVNLKGMTKDVFIRQMALITAIEFNKEFSSWTNELEPRKIDIGGATLDTVFNAMLINCNMNVSQQHSAGRNLDNNGYGAFWLFISALLMGKLIPFIRLVLVGLLFIIFYINITIIPVSRGGIQVESSLTMLISCLIGLVKVLFLMAIPSLLLLWYAKVDVNGVISLEANVSQSGNELEYILKIISLIVVSIACAFFGTTSGLRHLGFRKDPFSLTGFSFSLEQMATMDSGGTIKDISNIGGALGKGALTVGGLIAGSKLARGIGNSLSDLGDRIGNNKIVKGASAGLGTAKDVLVGGDRIVTDNKTGQQEIKHGVFGGKGGFRDQMKRENRNMVYDENYAKKLEEKTKEKKEEKIDNK